MSKLISRPTIAQYFIAYTGTAVLHYGITDTINETITGQDVLEGFDTPQEMLSRIEALALVPTLPSLPGVAADVFADTVYDNAGVATLCRVSGADINANPEAFVTKDTPQPLNYLEGAETRKGEIRRYEGDDYTSRVSIPVDRSNQRPNSAAADWSVVTAYMISPIATARANQSRLETAAKAVAVYSQASANGQQPATHVYTQVESQIDQFDDIKAEFPEAANDAQIALLVGAKIRYSNKLGVGDVPDGPSYPLDRFVADNGLVRIRVISEADRIPTRVRG